MTPTTIYLQTNYNNKLDCPSFIHIDAAPRVKPKYAQMDNTIIEIRTKDDSHGPVQVKLEDIMLMKVKDLFCLITWPSHGMRSWEFTHWLMEQKPELNMETPIAIYYYKKLLTS